jgi:dienelactone hydrolase
MHYHPSLPLLILLLLFGGVQPSLAQTLPAGPQVLTFFSDVDDTEQPYALYLPPSFDASRQYPLVVSLHGAGSNHRLNLRRVFGRSNQPGETDVEASRYFPEWRDVDFIVAAPFARGTVGYQGIAEKDVLEVLADVKRRFPIDEDRVYLTGLSMGGGGTLWIGLTRPDLWAAIAPVCPAPPQGTEALAPNALNQAVRFFHGEVDPVVPVEVSRTWVQRLRELGTHVEYDEYPGVAHDSWVPAYQDGKIFDWFSQFRRDPHPDRVRFATEHYRYDRAYWVRLDQLTPGTLARIDARFTGSNQLEITTSELGSFTLDLSAHPRYSAERALQARIDGRTVRVRPGEPLSFSRKGRRWSAAAYQAPPLAKRAGAEGPMSEVVSSHHIYVYGTAGNPSAEEIAARRAQAEHAANWSVDRGPFWGRVMVFPRTLADRDVRASDLEEANLVLFGTRETNTLIAQFADRLPLHLHPEARDEYGLIYVFPIGERYVLVSSGLPWWHTAEAAPAAPAPPARPRSPFAASVVALGLVGLEDFLLFRGSPHNVVAEGRFDTSWRLPEAAARVLRETAAVTLAPGAVTERTRPSQRGSIQVAP